MPQSNGNLSGLETAAYLHAAGFGESVLATAVSVAWAESSLNPKAYNPAAGGNWGLMQINAVHKPTAAEKTEPLANARRAFAIYKAAGNSFKPWEAYTSGAYHKYDQYGRESVTALKNNPGFEAQLLAGKNPGSDANPITNGGLKGEGPLGALDGKITDATSAIPNAISNGINSINSQFSKMGSNVLSIAVALVLLALGIVILARGAATSGAASVVKGVLK